MNQVQLPVSKLEAVAHKRKPTSSKLNASKAAVRAPVLQGLPRNAIVLWPLEEDRTHGVFIDGALGKRLRPHQVEGTSVFIDGCTDTMRRAV